jgi:hypothetical protein
MAEIPAYQVADARYHLVGQRGHAAATLDEFGLDAVLAQVDELVRPGVPEPTKASLAAAVKDAARIARQRAGAAVCGCGHPYGEHVGLCGCFECDCMARRPHASELAPAGGAA